MRRRLLSRGGSKAAALQSTGSLLPPRLRSLSGCAYLLPQGSSSSFQKVCSIDNDMTDVDPLISPKSKLSRAQTLIEDVSRHADVFFSGNLVEKFIEPEPGGARQIIKARFLKSVPPEVALVVADAIANMRSVLDHLAGCLAVKNGRELKDASFPFAGDWKQFGDAGVQKKIAALSPAARQMIRDFQPFRMDEAEPSKGGNNVLWALNKLRNTDMHDAIVPTALASLGHETSISTMTAVGYNVIEAPPRLVFGDDMVAELMRVPGNAEDIKGQAAFAFDFGFGDIDPVAGFPVSMVLNDFYNLVAKIVADAENQFFK